MTTEQIARICFEAISAYRHSLTGKPLASWDKAPKAERELFEKKAHFHVVNVDAAPAEAHNVWLKEKRDAGWTYGEIEDAGKKTHPHIVPFENLPIDQRIVESLFAGIVHSLVGFVNGKV